MPFRSPPLPPPRHLSLRTLAGPLLPSHNPVSPSQALGLSVCRSGSPPPVPFGPSPCPPTAVSERLLSPPSQASKEQGREEERERRRKKKKPTNPAASEIDALTPQLEAGTGVEPRPPSSARRGGEGVALGRDFSDVLIPFFPLLLPPSSAHSGASGTEMEKINK